MEYSNDYKHYLVKLSIDENLGYNREVIEYSYYLTATHLGIQMMPSHLIDQKHFVTERFDRQNGQKKHILTTSGITGWDFQKPENASYENLFELALFLKIPHRAIQELFKRTVFNVIFCNSDDHLKNHSFIYNEQKDSWNLAPAYDLTYSLNPLLNFKKNSRALSINGKRVDLKLVDLLAVAEKYSVKNGARIIAEVQAGIGFWRNEVLGLGVIEKIAKRMEKQFLKLI